MTKSNTSQQIHNTIDCKKYDGANLWQQRKATTKRLPYYIKLSMRVIKYLSCLFGFADLFAHNKERYIM